MLKKKFFKGLIVIFSFCFILINLTCIEDQLKPDNNKKDPVHLNIRNILQDTQYWCWAAVAQQIIYWKTNLYYNQCYLVGVSLNILPADYCCYFPSLCATGGNMNQIQSLIYYFGCSYSSQSYPANPEIVYNVLKSGKAIILFLRTSPYVGHFVVLEGMEWENEIPYFFINDPMSYYTQPWNFEQLKYLWEAAIVVY